MPFDVPPSTPPFTDDILVQIAQAVVRIMTGGQNVTGTVTLTASQASTVVDDDRVGPETVINMMPETLNAAGALSTTYISARTDGKFTISHANNAQTDRDFAYSIVG